MLAMVKRSDMEMLAGVSSDPVNSTHMLSTSDLSKKHRAEITSLPVTPGGKMPGKVIFAIGGICKTSNSAVDVRVAIASNTGCARPGVAFVYHDLVSHSVFSRVCSSKLTASKNAMRGSPGPASIQKSMPCLLASSMRPYFQRFDSEVMDTSWSILVEL